MSMRTGSRSRNAQPTNHKCEKVYLFHHSKISNEDRCVSAWWAEQTSHHGRAMLCDRQQRLNFARYLPRLSDCGALVGVLLVFILFKAPLTISETRNKPNGVKHLWRDDVIHPPMTQSTLDTSAYVIVPRGPLKLHSFFYQRKHFFSLVVSPPKLRLLLFLMPELSSISSTSSWVGDISPVSQPIMAGTFS